jgi:peptidoglycan/xylan/chitin deacetylase (PgdA/CDA1 family)
MDRRRFLLLLAAGLVGAAAGQGLAAEGGTELAAARPLPRRHRLAAASAPDAPDAPVAPTGVVSRLPRDDGTVALTVDDGVSSEVVAAYVALAQRTGIRLTFFPNGCYESWSDNAAQLRPLIESGQIAVGNHTWSHPYVTRLSDGDLAEQITRNQAFLRRTLGVDETPFFRPPYGAHDERTDRIVAELGHPTVVLWNGTLADERQITPAELVASAERYLAAGNIVIGHANHPTVTTVWADLLGLLRSRQLRTVSLADVWSAPARATHG